MRAAWEKAANTAPNCMKFDVHITDKANCAPIMTDNGMQCPLGFKADMQYNAFVNVLLEKLDAKNNRN